jgi:hypothetical protein
MVFRNNAAFLLIVFVTFILVGQVKADDAEISISTIKYTNDLENGELVTLVSSGKDNATNYKYKFYDDDDDDCDTQSCLPVNWYASDYDDSDWNLNATPFGNEELDGLEPNTIWQTEDGLGDYLVIRHYFTYEEPEEVLSATLNIAHNNYYMAYLNGNLIRDCSSYQNHDGCYEGDAEYWNNVLTYDGGQYSGPNPDWLIEGENVLVILGLDITWGGDTEQWLDVELAINVPSWKDTPIVLGDELVLRIDYFNYGENNETNISISLDIDEVFFSNKTIDIQNNQTYEWLIDWTPERLGDINVTAKVLNATFTRSIHIGYYAYSLNFSNEHRTSNVDETIEYEFTITNSGDVNDNFTFYLYDIPNDWNYLFLPNIASLTPNESMTVKLNITTSDTAQAGNYTVFPIIRSQYYSQTINTIIHSGASSSTEYQYAIWNGSDFPEDFYEMDYNDSTWEVGAAPFGNDELRGVEPNTLWQTDDTNYTYITARHWLNYTESLNFSELKISIAHDDYYRVYLNEKLIRDCFNGWGCGGDGRYWEDILTINSSWLNNGNNLIAIAARDSTQGWGGSGGGDGRQWLDMELETANLRSKLWDFQEIYKELTISVNETYELELLIPISNKDVSEEEYTFTIWAINTGNVKDTYDVTISLNDTDNFTIISYNSVLDIPYGQDRDIELKILLSDSINEFSLGAFSINIVSRNSTDELSDNAIITARMYVIPDTLSPGTYTQSPELINNSSFEVNWYVYEWYKTNEIMGNDTKYFIIEYMTDNGTNGESWGDWIFWNNFSSETESAIFPYGIDGYKYRFRSMGGDDENLVENKENKYDSQTLVDLSAPYANVNLRVSNNITNLDYIEIEWNINHPNITGYSAEYRFDDNQTWIIIEENTLAKWVGFNIPADGIYEFRVVTYDEAGNEGISDITEKLTVDTIAPNTNLVNIPELISSDSIIIDIENLEDTKNLSLYYSLSKEGEEAFPLEWILYGEYMTNDFPISISTVNKNHYYLKITAYDLVGNYILNESYEEFIVDQDIPNNIRNLELKDTKENDNGTTIIAITFKSSQSQDVTGYRIYRSMDQNETGEIVGYLESEEIYISYRDLGVEVGHKYYYSVVALDRMEFESEPETESISLETESVNTIIKNNKEDNNSIYIGGGILGLAALGAGYYLFNNKGLKGETLSSVAEVIIEEDTSNSNFTEVEGELLCSACGSMFEISGEKICPSCGVFDE